MNKQTKRSTDIAKKFVKFFPCGFCGSDHGCQCQKSIEQERRNEDPMRGGRGLQV